jgi:hypothetical protein
MDAMDVAFKVRSQQNKEHTGIKTKAATHCRVLYGTVSAKGLGMHVGRLRCLKYANTRVGRQNVASRKPILN